MPLLTPIQSANAILDQLKQLGCEQVLVAYSGGKDSLVVLSLAVRVFGRENVHAFTLYTLPQLECESARHGVCTLRYGIPLIQLPSPEIISLIRDGYGRRYSPTLDALLSAKYGWNDVERIVRYRTGIRWILYGHRAQDSLQRRGMLTRCQGVWERAYKGDKLVQRAYPLWQWGHKQVYSYLKVENLPIPHMFGNLAQNTSGLSLHDWQTVLYVKNKYPHDYQRLKAVFPKLDVPAWRAEVLARQAIKENT